ncbi:MAG: TMEM165/GDT1 family protein [Candidatus Omnitrophica bacterium]|jgi:putative Ca2+/H+ antiporter (TMEM165/GDT1 family)|nr:TMEM165/GDT1 family protein [Candidatus Omnitrophota bacterium]MDD3275134.1 TMEM165/GDT1 family protein [Candidatus Omnitrophota bacterium]MDD5078154.1 TMEM165/GDT1 family protein [Candidatus Omnitrophota bacterium]MDD5725712.1 TMEM165/GDT1 family protein [Candidatus Omnitrophota bacterium]
MEWKVFAATFAAVFFAELADKTQLVGIGMAAKTGRPLTVWFGSVAAYILVTVISVFLGALMARFIRPEMIRYFGASLFILVGALMLLKVI